MLHDHKISNGHGHNHSHDHNKVHDHDAHGHSHGAHELGNVSFEKGKNSNCICILENDHDF